VRPGTRRGAGGLAIVLVAGLLTACSSSSSKGKATATTRPVTTTTVVPAYTARVASERIVDPAYRQGVAKTPTGWIFSVNNGLYSTDDNFVQTKAVSPEIPAQWAAQGFNHIGDIDVENGVLYAPLEQPDYTKGYQAMLTFDPVTLAYKTGLRVPQHQNSFVTVDPATHIAYTMDQFGGKALLRYDVAHGWQPLAPLAMSLFVDKVQGADLHDGAAWLSTDDARDEVYRVDLATGAVQLLGSIGHVDGEGEGIDATPTAAGDLHVLSVDVKIVPVRQIELKVTASATG
jgi:hypothetical protein